MNTFSSLCRSLLAPFTSLRTQPTKAADSKPSRSLHEYSFTSMDGTVVPFSTFKGKKILIVNVASRCGFTPQYEDLEVLSRTHPDNLVIIGFPANDFLGQEPGTNKEIATFCKTAYGVSFPLSKKVSVIGKDQTSTYQWLTNPKLNGWNKQSPKWNFYKYLIDEMGALINVFPSSTKPLSKELVGAINSPRETAQ